MTAAPRATGAARAVALTVARMVSSTFALTLVVLVAVGLALGVDAVRALRARTHALGTRTEVLEVENAWLRTRLGALDARLRQLELRSDVSAGAVDIPSHDSISSGTQPWP